MTAPDAKEKSTLAVKTELAARPVSMQAALPRRPGEVPGTGMRGLLTGWHAVLDVAKKICVLGDPAVGKTSLIRRYAFDSYDDTYTTTVGVRILNRTQVLRYPERGVELRLKFRIWEVSGQNRHTELYPAYYRGADGAIVVGDATRVETQVNMWKWIEGFRAAAGRVPIILLLNKSDIAQKGDLDDGLTDEIAREFGCPFRVASAREGSNVERVFREMAFRLIGRNAVPRWKVPNTG